jgi:hypothetical protein
MWVERCVASVVYTVNSTLHEMKKKSVWLGEFWATDRGDGREALIGALGKLGHSMLCL